MGVNFPLSSTSCSQEDFQDATIPRVALSDYHPYNSAPEDVSGAFQRMTANDMDNEIQQEAEVCTDQLQTMYSILVLSNWS